jgi:hypothetical protein
MARAKEIAGRTVNKERAQRGQQLYNEARQRNIPGRSRMNKDELRRAVDARR